MHNGKVYGSNMPMSDMGCDTMEQAAKFLCWTGTTLVASAVLAGATVAFSYEVKWWFQVQELLNCGDQVLRTFELTAIQYGQSQYELQILELQVNGAPTAQNGIDVRNWNFEIYQRFYPLPASGLNDATTVTFTNVDVNPQDFCMVVMGPAVLQIG
jgi:hypothetical protein